MEQVSYNLQPLWDSILSIWRVVWKLCKKHNIRVWVAYGTAIGAMRHKGFIPWDDDFDVYMPREDYNKFMKIAQKELPPNMKWRSIETDPKYVLNFGKIFITDTNEVAKVQHDSSLLLEQGVFIDFFPMDGLPGSKIGLFLMYLKRAILRRIGSVLFSPLTLRNSYLKFLSIFLPCFKTAQEWRLYLQAWLSRRPFDGSENVGWPDDNYNNGRVARKREWFTGTRMVPFSDIEVPVCSGVEMELTKYYGDWHELPPEDQRKPGHQILPASLRK